METGSAAYVVGFALDEVVDHSDLLGRKEVRHVSCVQNM